MRLAGRVLAVLGVIVALVYASLCAFLFVKQRSMIYFPRPAAVEDGANLMTLHAAGDTVLVSTYPHAGPDAVVYFGGNADDVSRDVPEYVEAFPGYAVYLLHYPGFGGSTGSPTEASIVASGLELFDQVHAEHPNVVVIGASLGTGVAVRVASERPVSRLVLVTPYASLDDPASERYPYIPVRWLLRDKFDSWRYAPQVTAPTRILVAERDEVIPRWSSERLRASFRPGVAEYYVLPGVGHVTVSSSPEYWPLVEGAGR